MFFVRFKFRGLLIFLRWNKCCLTQLLIQFSVATDLSNLTMLLELLGLKS